MKFDQLKNDFSWPRLEEEVLKFWEKRKIFKKSIDQAIDRERFIFFEGPPTANGQPGVHHIISRTIKDLVCRYKAMKGYRVDRKAGWDTHGLPVEVEVEKALNLRTKHDIINYGVAKFNEKCKESVFRYKKDWDELTRRIGYWLDLDKAYITLENYYIESVWNILTNFFNRGLIYDGYKTIPFCPRCETPLSSHEVGQAYADVDDPSVYVRMRAVDDDFSYLVWTTTPWTLPSNAAICLHPNEYYVRVKYGDEDLVLAEALADRVLGHDVEVLDRKKGSEYRDRKYVPLFGTFENQKDNAFYVINADFVTMEDGTGIVHIAPGFGADDYEMGKKYGLPILQAIHETGIFKEDTGWLAGKYIKDADPEIVADLDKRGLLFRSEIYTHSYPFCWRCDTPLIYIARKSWYIRTTQFKDKLLQYNRRINWVPPEIGSGRFGEWLENNVDWALSRERFWGTPLPIWICEECNARQAVGSIKQLKEQGIDVPKDIELHKPYIDAIELKCPECSGKMKRVPEVIDVWFDSGAMPFAQWHYPFEHKEEFENLFPAEFISEAVDQTRGWFYTLLTISTIFYDQPCFLNCLVMEFVVDKEGKKMSKHVGNVIEPFDMLNKYGADAVRWYMISTSHPWIALKFDPAGVEVIQRKFFDTFKNCYAFWALYTNIDDIADKAASERISVGNYLRTRKGKPQLTDKWVISRFNSTVKQVTEAMDGYNLTRAARVIQDFVIEDLSNWYIRLNRPRFYSGGEDPDKFLVYSILHDILMGVCGLAAPIMPFFSDYVYRQLLGKSSDSEPESIHLTTYPEFNESLIDTRMEYEMGFAQKIVSLALAARQHRSLKVRQPLARMLIHFESGPKFSENLTHVVLKELNVKNLEYLENPRDYIDFTIRPDFNKLGPKYGKEVKGIAEHLKHLSNDKVIQAESEGRIKVEINERQFDLNLDEVEIIRKAKEGFTVESEAGITVILDTSLDESLIDEGFARELVNKIQNVRKSSGFEVTDRIKITLYANEPLATAADKYRDYICTETLADSLDQQELNRADGGKEWSINGEKAVISVVRK